MGQNIEQTHTTPRLTVVGAGTGDPELLTIKAVKALQQADVVLYDALVNEQLFKYVRPDAVRVFVGKRRRHKAFEQSDINRLIVDYARDYGHVVRLKGGDPFVFGRGREEMLYASGHGLATEYIPGISSAIAGPGAVGIPVTLRGVSRSFWVMTATLDNGELNPEIAVAAATHTTVVILMGLAKIDQIADIYTGIGKSGLPAAIIQDATLPQQTAIMGPIGQLARLATEHSNAAPGVIVVGEVVRYGIETTAFLQNITQH